MTFFPYLLFVCGYVRYFSWYLIWKSIFFFRKLETWRKMKWIWTIVVWVVMATQERSNQCKDDRTPTFINCMFDHDDPSASRRLSGPLYTKLFTKPHCFIYSCVWNSCCTQISFFCILGSALWTENQPKVTVSTDRSKLVSTDRSKLVSNSQCQLGNKDLNIQVNKWHRNNIITLLRDDGIHL